MNVRTLLGFRKSGQPIWLARGGAPTTVEQLRARLAAIAAEMRTINETAGDDDLTTEQTLRWEELEAEHTTRTEEIEREERAARVRESRARWGGTQFGDKPDPFDGRDLRTLSRNELRSKALTVVGDAENVRHFDLMGADGARAQEHVSKLLRTQSKNFDGASFARMVLATENPHYRSAFMKVMAGQPHFDNDEVRALNQVAELRAAMSLSDGNGGYAVPVLIDPTIILTAQGHPNDFFDISRVEDITTDEWRGVSSAGATSYWTTEGTTTTGGEPTLAQPTVPTKKLTTYIKWSFEIGGDYPNFGAEMGNVMGESHNEALVAAFTNGLGTTAQPTGVVKAIKDGGASFQVAVSTDGALFANDLYKLWDALPIRFRTNARWMASTSVSNAIRQFAAGSNNSDANFTVNITQATVERVFGKPFHYNDYMDDAVGTGQVTSASDLALVLVGDFRNFLIARRVGATVETVQHVIDTTTGNPTGQRGTLMWARVGSDSVNDNGFRLLTQD